MKPIANMLYRRPVIFAGVIVGGSVALGVANVIPDWIGLVAAAIFAPITQQYTTPAKAPRR